MLIPGLSIGWEESWRSVAGVSINRGDLKIIDPQSSKLVPVIMKFVTVTTHMQLSEC
jgi:hypothetical protein